MIRLKRNAKIVTVVVHHALDFKIVKNARIMFYINLYVTLICIFSVKNAEILTGTCEYSCKEGYFWALSEQE